MFARWIGTLHYKKHCERLLSKFWVRSGRTCLQRVYSLWLDAVDETQAQQREQQKLATSKQAIEPKSTKKDTNREIERLNSAGTRNVHEASQQHVRMVRMGKYKQRWRRVSGHLQLQRWLDYCLTRRWHARVSNQVSCRRSMLLISDAFSEWLRVAQASKERRQLGRGKGDFVELLVDYFRNTTVASSTRSCLWQSWDALEKNCHLRRQQMQGMNIVANRFRSRFISKAWCAFQKETVSAFCASQHGALWYEYCAHNFQSLA